VLKNLTNIQTNFSTFPKGWVWAKLDELAQIILGQSPPSSTYNEKRQGLPFYQGKLEFGKIYPNPRQWCTRPKKIAEKGDVLISVRAPVGPTNICPAKSCIGRGLAAIHGLGGIETMFFLYLMRAFEDKISGKGTGTTFDAITGDQLKKFEIPLPPLPEQHRIVAKVEELFTKFNAGVEALKKIKAQLKRYRQAVLKYAFEGKLTEEWWKTHNLPTAPLEKGDKGFDNLPEGWKWTNVGDISDRIHYGYTASATDKPIGPKMLRITDIQNNTVDWDAVPYCQIDPDGKKKYLLNQGDLVFARTGATVGKSFLIKSTISEAVFASYLIRVILNNQVDRKYVYNFFQSHMYWAQIRRDQIGIGQPNVNSQKLSKIILPLPSIEEQHQIVSEIERRFSDVDEIEKIVDTSSTQSERLRQSILKRAFEGKLVPQDANDEPAGKLLERIKLEKATMEESNKKKGKRLLRLRLETSRAHNEKIKRRK
jgi:type I restriction enzyme S subunit